MPDLSWQSRVGELEQDHWAGPVLDLTFSWTLCRKPMEPVQSMKYQPPEVCVVCMLDTELQVAAQTFVAVYVDHRSAIEAELLDVLSLC